MYLPGLIKCNIVEMVSILIFSIFFDLVKSFHVQNKTKNPIRFLTNKYGWNKFPHSQISNSQISTLSDLASNVLISAVINYCSFLLNGYWYNFTIGRLSVVSLWIPDTVVRISGSDISSYHCFRWNLRGPLWNDLTLFWRCFLMRSKFFTCNAFVMVP